jgi:regulator of protease activity HflC (stomatin/prohibitin superfamily)
MQRFGAYSSYKEAGLNCYIWPCYSSAETLTFKVETLNVRIQTKTIDNVFVSVEVAMNYQVMRDDGPSLYNAFYGLSDREAQMTAYIKDALRCSICSMTLDGAYSGKEEVSQYLKSHLSETFVTYGISIVGVLITEILPDTRVMNAMNEINASRRLKEAAAQRAEGEKTIKVKQAEAEAESMYLNGVGVARQRAAIMKGLQESVILFNDSKGTSAKDVMDLLILNQYFDMLDAIGTTDGCRTIMVPSGNADLRQVLMESAQVNR